MSELNGSSAITFEVISPIYSIETLKHMRAGSKATAKAVEGSVTMFKIGNYVFNLRAIQRAVDDKYIRILSFK